MEKELSYQYGRLIKLGGAANIFPYYNIYLYKINFAQKLNKQLGNFHEIFDGFIYNINICAGFLKRCIQNDCMSLFEYMEIHFRKMRLPVPLNAKMTPIDLNKSYLYDAGMTIADDKKTYLSIQQTYRRDFKYVRVKVRMGDFTITCIHDLAAKVEEERKCKSYNSEEDEDYEDYLA